MINLKEIKKAVSDVLQSEFPGTPVYGIDTVEGYKRPSFFVTISLDILEATKNCVHKTAEIEIDYIQPAPDEEKALDFFTKTEQRFLPKLYAGDRKLTTSEFYFDFLGDHGDIPHVEFQTEFWDDWGTEETAELMKEFNMKQEVK